MVVAAGSVAVVVPVVNDSWGSRTTIEVPSRTSPAVAVADVAIAKSPLPTAV